MHFVFSFVSRIKRYFSILILCGLTTITSANEDSNFNNALFSLGIKEGTEAFFLTTNAMRGRSYKEQAIIAGSCAAVFTGAAIGIGAATAGLLNVDVEEDKIKAKNAKRLGECLLKGYGAFELNKLQNKLQKLRTNDEDVSTVPIGEVLSSTLPSLFREGAELGFGTGFSLAGTLDNETKMTALYASLSALGGAASPLAICGVGYGAYKAGQRCGLISEDFFDKYTKPINSATNLVIDSLKIALASGAIHEGAELLNADLRVWDLGDDFSHKENAHWGAVAAVTGYSGNPDIFQLSTIIAGWAKILYTPSVRAIKHGVNWCRGGTNVQRNQLNGTTERYTPKDNLGTSISIENPAYDDTHASTIWAQVFP